VKNAKIKGTPIFWGLQYHNLLTRGPRAWRSADDFEEMERILQIFSERRKYAA
jgi:hypothetical protein